MADTSHNKFIRKHGEEKDGLIIPQHYVQGKFQLIDVMQTQLSKVEYIGWSKALILKYLIRNSEESILRPAIKAKYYLDEMINFLADTEKSSEKHIKPKYYKNDKLGIETIDIIEDQLPEEEKIGFYKGMVIRYICRSSYKEHLYDDLLKAKYYLDRLINILQKEEKEDGVQG